MLHHSALKILGSWRHRKRIFRPNMSEVWAHFTSLLLWRATCKRSSFSLNWNMASKASYRPVVKRSSSELIDVLDSSETSAAGKCCDFAFESWISTTSMEVEQDQTKWWFNHGLSFICLELTSRIEKTFILYQYIWSVSTI